MFCKCFILHVTTVLVKVSIRVFFHFPPFSPVRFVNFVSATTHVLNTPVATESSDNDNDIHRE